MSWTCDKHGRGVPVKCARCVEEEAARALLAQLEAAKRDSKLLREGLQRIATLTIDLRDHSAVTMARFASNVLAGRSYFDSDGAPDNAD